MCAKFCIPILFIQPLYPSLPPSPNPDPKSYRVLVLELQARGKKNKRNEWEKKDSNIHNN